MPKINLADYTEKEILMLPAGPLLDWLALLALLPKNALLDGSDYPCGQSIITAPAPGYTHDGAQLIAIWKTNEDAPCYIATDSRVSRDPGAAMRALLALKECVSGYHGYSPDGCCSWYVYCPTAALRVEHQDFFVVIAQACALWWLKEIRTEKENENNA